ncbi:IS110 family transposase [Novosphingobium sp. ERN07]|uniref:IS110 family transposase n=1 Tax=Novosphingobium sp. ERN07 TaxID=2726187 RepID=UPI0014568923|nr:transposase [Novosphingobium sp. ERN07]NLR73446.1 IS110 family transposase [Novosphingobium sp. ERN07]
MKHYAGLDLPMESTQVCIVDESGRKLVSEKVESTPEALAAMLERYRPIERAVIETGRMSPAICLGLRELGIPVVCIDARQAHQSLKAMKANKTDPHDAAGLAQLARTGFYKEVHVKSPAAHGAPSVITARSHLVEARVRLDNTILTRSKETFALKTWAMKVAKRRGLKKARVALARRLAVIMHAMLRDGTLFQA